MEDGSLSPKARILPPGALFPALPRAARSVPGAQPSGEAPRSMATDAKARQAEAAAQALFLLPHIQQRARSVLYPGRKGRLRLEHPAPLLSSCHPRSSGAHGGASGLHRRVSAPLGTASPRTASCWNSPAPVFWGQAGQEEACTELCGACRQPGSHQLPRPAGHKPPSRAPVRHRETTERQQFFSAHFFCR